MKLRAKEEPLGSGSVEQPLPGLFLALLASRLRQASVLILEGVGIAALAAAICALGVADWRPHTVSLLYRSWLSFLESEATSTTGIISNWAFPILIIAIPLWLVFRKRGWSAVMEHFREEAVTAVRVTVVVILLTFGPVFIWNFVRTIFGDHQMMVRENATLRAQNRKLKPVEAPISETGAIVGFGRLLVSPPTNKEQFFINIYLPNRGAFGLVPIGETRVKTRLAEQPKRHWTARFNFSRIAVAGETEASPAGEQLAEGSPLEDSSS